MPVPNDLKTLASETVPSNHLEAQQNAEGPVRQLLALLPMTALWALLAQGILSVTRLLTSMTVGGKFSPVAALGTDRNEQLGLLLDRVLNADVGCCVIRGIYNDTTDRF